MKSIFENYRSKDQRLWSPHDQTWANIQLWSHNSIKYPRQELCKLKRLIGAFPEIWGQRQSLPCDQIGAKLQFKIHNFIQMYQVATLVNGKDLIWHVIQFFFKYVVWKRSCYAQIYTFLKQKKAPFVYIGMQTLKCRILEVLCVKAWMVLGHYKLLSVLPVF